MKAVRKGEFAKMMSLSPGRISQYLRDGILHDCLLPDGRLNLAEARRELEANRDPLKVEDYKLRYDVQRKQRVKKVDPVKRNLNPKKVWCEDLGIFLDFSEYVHKPKKNRIGKREGIQ